ncbi:hypothetical protein THF5H11_10828 [Vibrio jasicida]|uniref:Uncharacterized protein n=1 Tax=Vibrio jasicida TaxID=766224 RepID=A0AAU9R1X4_9VIBR|nr:hypothetical protein THF5H11_10828 [Vibrio jasicida]CAH1558688.1 hypothetical protein THF1C08_100128 [Vibrio jasicida]CAH1604023.1 hypothetical protein THF1A12_90127 [Vibrio jasicida]
MDLPLRNLQASFPLNGYYNVVQYAGGLESSLDAVSGLLARLT